MVEFALVLPILLFVILGLFEFGRLIFIYGTVVTAAREAARYGSSSNWNNDISIRVYEGQYRDCPCIRGRSEHVDFFNVFTDGEITIQYDHGPGGTGPVSSNIPGYPNIIATCDTSGNFILYPDQRFYASDRIVVQVTADFTPMMGLVPIPSFTVRSVSARTLLGMIVLDSYIPFPSAEHNYHLHWYRSIGFTFPGYFLQPKQ